MKNSNFNLTLATMCLVVLFLITGFGTGCKDECDNVSCEHGGTCVDGSCNCPAGYSGTNCEIVDFKYAAGKYFGDTISLGNGIVRTWAEVDEDGNPIAIGANFPEATLDSLNDFEEYFSIPMPDEAYNTFFDHLFFVWVSHGHPPFWFAPHLDLHFVMVSETERENVIPGADVIPILDRYIPQDYISDAGNIGDVVPRMGVHWWDSTATEVNGGLFTTTMLYGAYHGNITFIEPMISSSYLQTKTSVTYDIKQPESYQREGYWPTKYSVTYHAATKEFDVTLQGFVKRERG